MANLRLLKNNKGSVAVVAMVLLTFLAALVLGFASRSVFQSKRVRGFNDTRQALYTAEAGIEYACYEAKKTTAAATAITTKPDSQVITTILDGGSFSYVPFSDSGFGTAQLLCSYSAGFLKILATGSYRKAKKTISVTLGAKLPEIYKSGLVLFGESPVQVRGGTVTGRVVLKVPSNPPGAFLECESLKEPLPPFNNKLFKNTMDSLFHESQQGDSGKSKMGELVTYNSSSVPDLKNHPLLSHIGNVLLHSDAIGKQLIIEGPGIIEAGQGIQVSGKAILKNVTLVAQGDITCFDEVKLIDCTLLSYKRVHIGNKAEFSGSIYCNGTIEAAEDSKIKPYSLLYCLGQNKGSNNQLVSITESAEVAGTILSPATMGIVFLDKDARFSGIIFTQASVDIRGIVLGTVIARDFLAKTEDDKSFAPAFMGGKIDHDAMPTDYSAPLGLLTQPDFCITSWEVVK